MVRVRDPPLSMCHYGTIEIVLLLLSLHHVNRSLAHGADVCEGGAIYSVSNMTYIDIHR